MKFSITGFFSKCDQIRIFLCSAVYWLFQRDIWNLSNIYDGVCHKELHLKRLTGFWRRVSGYGKVFDYDLFQAYIKCA